MGDRRVAIVTGASKGLGRALARALAADGWSLVLDARGVTALHDLAGELRPLTEVVAIPGDVADEAHRQELVAAAKRFGRLDLVVNNASDLGPSPLPHVADHPLDVLERL